MFKAKEKTNKIDNTEPQAKKEPELFTNWAINNRRVVPNKIGTKFTEDQTASIMKYLDDNGIEYTKEYSRDEFGNAT